MTIFRNLLLLSKPQGSVSYTEEELTIGPISCPVILITSDRCPLLSPRSEPNPRKVFFILILIHFKSIKSFATFFVPLFFIFTLVEGYWLPAAG
jgi:hypothetical protein